ncbi:EamA family transporter [Galbibacter sp. PAP.153]|uniref:EamA family transporter n=1 Tax=Galbibacter sp. PAP.153 TaxID=3104623 RepID=UPI00300BB9F5
MDFKVILALLALYLGWGSTYLAIAVALEHFPPFMLAGIRFFLAGSIFFGWCLLQRIKIPPDKDILKICLAGFFLLFLGSGSVIWVSQFLSTGIIAIIWASLPVWLVVMDRNNWKFYLPNFKLIAGLIIGFFGVLILFWDKTSNNGTFRELIMAIGGVLCFSIGSLYSKYVSFKNNILMVVAIQMIFVGVLAIATSICIGEDMPTSTNISFTKSALGLAYLIIIGSLVAYSAYVWLLKVLPPIVVGTYTYINPAVAVFLGWWFLKEDVTNQKIVALTLIFIGTLIVNIYKSKTQKL